MGYRFKKTMNTKTIKQLRKEILSGRRKKHPIPLEEIINNLTKKDIETLQTLVNKQIEDMVCSEFIIGLWKIFGEDSPLFKSYPTQTIK
jgi:hypothetical protein